MLITMVVWPLVYGSWLLEGHDWQLNQSYNDSDMIEMKVNEKEEVLY